MSSSRVTTTVATMFPRLQTLAARAVLQQCSCDKDVSELTKENGAIGDALQEELEQLKLRVYQLLQHIVCCEQDQAEAMLKGNLSYLLFYQGTVEDCSHRTLTGTALQLAYGAQDVEMCEMLLPYFEQLKEGREEVFRQIQEQFPEGLVEKEPYDFDFITEKILKSSEKEVSNALTFVQDDSSLCKALNEFRKNFTERSMQDGIHFDPRHLLQGLSLATKNSFEDTLSGFDWNQEHLFWNQVIGYVRRYFPACYAQALSQGVYPVAKKLKLLQRSFDLSTPFFLLLCREKNEGLQALTHSLRTVERPLEVKPK